MEENVLHNFKLDCNGFLPYGTLTMDKAGNLYGTTNGLCNTGTVGGVVFELIRNDGNWTEKVRYSFSNNSYGPDRDLILNKAGNVWHDRRKWCLQLRHCLQAIIARGQNGKWTEKVLYSFPDNTVFSFSSHGDLAFDTTGTLYGTTSNAGDTSCSDGCGNVFELTPHANGKWTGKVLYNFISNGQDGYPSADVTLDKAGSLYETTSSGGAVSVCLDFGGCGTLFELIPRIRLGFRPLEPT